MASGHQTNAVPPPPAHNPTANSTPGLADNYNTTDRPANASGNVSLTAPSQPTAGQAPLRQGRKPANPNDTKHLEDKIYGLVSMEDLMAMAEDAFAELDISKDNEVITEVKEVDRIEELSQDGLNDYKYGASSSRRLYSNSMPNPGPQLSPANVTHVPISAPVATDTNAHYVPVVRNTQYTDTGLRDLAGLTRQANTAARMEGSLPSTIAHILGTEELGETEAPLMGMTTRIVQARLAAASGATAAVTPNVPGWDVQYTSASELNGAYTTWSGYQMMYVPSNLPFDAARALLSLLLPGGAAAYGWRFRAEGDVRAGSMPVYVRWKHPGGTRRVLAVFESARTPQQLQLGGAALTVAALTGLEQFYRREWGDLYFDHAYRAVIAASHVYVDPVPLANFDIGTGFEPKGLTTTHNGTNFAGRAFNWSNPPSPPPVQQAPTVRPFVNVMYRPPGQDRGIITYFRGQNAADAQIPMAARVNFGWYEQIVNIEWDRQQGNQMIRESRVATIEAIITWLVANNREPVVRVWLSARLNQELQIALTERGPEGGTDDSDVELDGFRNVYSMNVKAMQMMPEFDLRLLAGLIARAMKVLTRAVGNSTILAADLGELQHRAQTYALRLHICHLFVLTEHHVWPDRLDKIQYDHRAIVAKLPKGLSNLCAVLDFNRQQLDAANWQMVEQVYFLKGTRMGTAYYGFNVTGTWITDREGRTEAASPDTNYPALDAALRYGWLYNATTDIENTRTQAFKPILALDPAINVRLFNPLGWAPYASTGRFLANTVFIPRGGHDNLGRQMNATYDNIQCN